MPVKIVNNFLVDRGKRITMTPHSMSSSNFVELSSTSLPWGAEIWREDESWFTLAQLLWVKLFTSPMSYGQLHYIISAPLIPMVSSPNNADYRRRTMVRDDRSKIYEMELIMDPTRGILLIGEVYGQPGDRVWRPEKIYRRLIELSAVLTEFFQHELLGEKAALFSPGYALILRDVDRDQLPACSSLYGVNTITRDELSTIHLHLNRLMNHHANEMEIPFRSYGHVVIEALRNISNNSQGEIAGFRTADEIYQAPRLPAWLR